MSQLIIPRRSFIKGVASLMVAPVIVRVENIMPIKSYEVDFLLNFREFCEEALRSGFIYKGVYYKL